MKDSARWLLVAALVWLAAWGWSRAKPPHGPPPSARPEWQRLSRELSPEQQQLFTRVRAALPLAEAAHTDAGWPDTLPGLDFPARKRGLVTNYLGEGEGLRWLVLYLDPDPRLPREDAGVDDEHHRLADGTPVHVTVWTTALDAGLPDDVVAFPAAEGWVEQVRAD